MGIGHCASSIGLCALTTIHRQIRRTIERHGMCPPGSRVLVALSGGADSVALTFLLRELAAPLEFVVAGAAHLNHQLRPSAARDEQFCRDLTSRLDVPFVAETIDVSGYASAQRLSLEDAARRLRYDFLHRAAGQLGADRIAVGHTRDDQAETVLLKLVRGAGLTGLAGIHPRKGALIRPLLDVARTDLRSYLTERGEGWVEDETNEDLDNPRNRIRRVVLPELDRAYGGPVTPAIARTAELAREDGQYLDSLCERQYSALAALLPDGVELDAAAVREQPLPVRRRILLKALRAVSGNREVGQDHVDAALRVLTGACGPMDAPGSRVELRRGKLVLVEQGSPLR
jgi:tRNA(Ile)-lysidine synthase